MEEILSFEYNNKVLNVKSTDISSIIRENEKIIFEYISNGMKYDYTFVFHGDYYSGSHYANETLKKWIKKWKKSLENI